MVEHNRNFFTVREFCERNAISPATFYRAVNSGRVKISKLGKRTLVSAEVEAAFVASLSAEAA